MNNVTKQMNIKRVFLYAVELKVRKLEEIDLKLKITIDSHLILEE